MEKNNSGVTSLELNGKDLKRISIKIDGELVDESRLVEIDESLLIRQVPDAFTLEVVTQINPEANTALEGLYLSNGMFVRNARLRVSGGSPTTQIALT